VELDNSVPAFASASDYIDSCGFYRLVGYSASAAKAETQAINQCA